jgi:hypothetical protein
VDKSSLRASGVGRGITWPPLMKVLRKAGHDVSRHAVDTDALRDPHHRREAAAANLRISWSRASESRSTPPWSDAIALMMSRYRRAIRERPSTLGNNSRPFDTRERACAFRCSRGFAGSRGSRSLFPEAFSSPGTTCNSRLFMIQTSLFELLRIAPRPPGSSSPADNLGHRLGRSVYGDGDDGEGVTRPRAGQFQKLLLCLNAGVCVRWTR